MNANNIGSGETGHARLNDCLFPSSDIAHMLLNAKILTYFTEFCLAGKCFVKMNLFLYGVNQSIRVFQAHLKVDGYVLRFYDIFYKKR